MAKTQPSDHHPTRHQVGQGRLRPPVGLIATDQQGIMIRLFWV